MKIILLTDVPELGRKNDVKEVKDGYARNFLLARKLAVLATTRALKELEARQKKEEEQKENKKTEIKNIFEKIKNQEFEIKEKANEKGELFGSVNKDLILEILKKEGKELVIIDKEWIKLDKPIKNIGSHKIYLEFEDSKSSFILKIIAE